MMKVKPLPCLRTQRPLFPSMQLLEMAGILTAGMVKNYQPQLMHPLHTSLPKV